MAQSQVMRPQNNAFAVCFSQSVNLARESHIAVSAAGMGEDWQFSRIGSLVQIRQLKRNQPDADAPFPRF
ncbi:MAG: hypothetical protein ABSF34_21595, partial [Verrucomicrobiota bacterium]